MYCIRCGVELSEGQTLCPICGTKVCHPDFSSGSGPYTYPKKKEPAEEISRKGILFIMTVLCVLALGLPLMFELLLTGTVAWSGYVAGAVLLVYLMIILPLWLKHPNPVVFIPCDFAGIVVYLFYICFLTEGEWYWSFALPITIAFALILTALITLLRYLRRGKLYIYGGFLIALGAYTVLIDLLLRVTFPIGNVILWSTFSAATGFMLGMMLIVIAIVKPLRESLRKRFFLG